MKTVLVAVAAALALAMTAASAEALPDFDARTVTGDDSALWEEGNEYA